MTNKNGFESAPANVREIVFSLRDGLQEIFGDKLLGLYLYGSLSYDCFNPKSSDIDFVAVLESEPTSDEEKKLYDLHERLSKEPEFGRRIDGTYLTEQQAKADVYPTPFLFCTMAGTLQKAQETKGDPDFPIHRQHLHDCGLKIVGAEPRELFLPVPWKILEQSLLQELPFIKEQFEKNPIYAVLNLCRVVRALELKSVSSKTEAGEWALQNFPSEWHELVRVALEGYKHELDEGQKRFLTENLDRFYQYCEKKIVKK